MNEVNEFIAAVRLQQWFASAGDRLVASVVVAAVPAAVFAVLGSVTGVLIVFGIALTAAGIGFATARPTWIDVAGRIDGHSGAAELVSTAAGLAVDEPFAAAVVASAVARLRAVDRRAVVTRRFGRRAAWVAALVVLIEGATVVLIRSTPTSVLPRDSVASLLDPPKSSTVNGPAIRPPTASDGDESRFGQSPVESITTGDITARTGDGSAGGGGESHTTSVDRQTLSQGGDVTPNGTDGAGGGKTSPGSAGGGTGGGGTDSRPSGTTAGVDGVADDSGVRRRSRASIPDSYKPIAREYFTRT